MGGGERGGGSAIHYTPSGPCWVDDTNEIKGMAKGQGGKVEKVTQDEEWYWIAGIPTFTNRMRERRKKSGSIPVLACTYF